MTLASLSAQTYETMVDAQIMARKLLCAECDSPVAEYPLWSKETGKQWTVRCLRSKGQHALRAKGKNAVQVYLETGEGDALTRQQAERLELKQARKREEER